MDLLPIKDSKMSIMELGIIVIVDGEATTEDGEILEDSNLLHPNHLNKVDGDNKVVEIPAAGGNRAEVTELAGGSRVVEMAKLAGGSKAEETDNKVGASKVVMEVIVVGVIREDGDMIALKFI